MHMDNGSKKLWLAYGLLICSHDYLHNFVNMVHKQEGADKLHNSDMCGIQWDMSPDGHCGPPPGTLLSSSRTAVTRLTDGPGQ